MTRKNGVSLFQHDDVKINEYWMFRPCWLASSSRRFGRVLLSFSGSDRPLPTREVKVIHIIRQCTLFWICVRRGSWPFGVTPFQKLNYFVEEIQLCRLFLSQYNAVLGKTSHVLAALWYAANSFIWPISFSLHWMFQETAGNVLLAEIYIFGESRFTAFRSVCYS
jgi:hypothetical protein